MGTEEMDVRITPLSKDDREGVIDIFNHYVENSFAAYPEHKMPYQFFDSILEMSEGYPAVSVKDEGGNILGFGMLRAYSPFPTFSQTAEITYFIKPGYTGRGIGKRMLHSLIEQAKEKGITSILASISSLNTGSISFHKENGFAECGRFEGIGNKRGKAFDVVYMQKKL
ncbi:MAG TPA: GNAT family N-acetyltransferase [Thermodesulfovibrionales bacterium]|nr:GNAT family N-acetyltransferase [Thermodesulfovibrionales bacterium]